MLLEASSHLSIRCALLTLEMCRQTFFRFYNWAFKCKCRGRTLRSESWKQGPCKFRKSRAKWRKYEALHNLMSLELTIFQSLRSLARQNNSAGGLFSAPSFYISSDNGKIVTCRKWIAASIVSPHLLFHFAETFRSGDLQFGSKDSLKKMSNSCEQNRSIFLHYVCSGRRNSEKKSL